jgi:hypothetical protein
VGGGGGRSIQKNLCSSLFIHVHQIDFERIGYFRKDFPIFRTKGGLANVPFQSANRESANSWAYFAFTIQQISRCISLQIENPQFSMIMTPLLKSYAPFRPFIFMVKPLRKLILSQICSAKLFCWVL